MWTIVLAAGRGARFGAEEPKQYLALGDRRVLDWSLEQARQTSAGVVLVVDPDRVDQHAGEADAVVGGGSQRSDSVRAGLRAVPDEATVILVHDAARPLASRELFRRVIDGLDGPVDGVIPAVPVTDTIKVVEGGVVTETLDRSRLVAVQTPQAFRAEILRRAHEGEHDATDDAALVESLGGRVVVVPGEAANLKITEPDDLVTAERLLA